MRGLVCFARTAMTGVCPQCGMVGLRPDSGNGVRFGRHCPMTPLTPADIVELIVGELTIVELGRAFRHPDEDQLAGVGA
jgi:hypothetical protein